jgi:hypothetical protein
VRENVWVRENEGTIGSLSALVDVPPMGIRSGTRYMSHTFNVPSLLVRLAEHKFAKMSKEVEQRQKNSTY